MSKLYCEACGSIEMGFRAPNEQEIWEMELDPDLYSPNNRDYEVCTQCGAHGTERVLTFPKLKLVAE